MTTPITSPLTGIVQMVWLDSGDQVLQDEPIMELEVMKMMTSVLAPVSGILMLKVGPGDFVNEGDLIAEVTPQCSPTTQ